MTTYDTWDLMDTLDVRIPLKFILPGRDTEKSVRMLAHARLRNSDPRPTASDEGMRAQLAWRRPENASNVIIPEAGHLIAQEAPVQLGEWTPCVARDVLRADGDV